MKVFQGVYCHDCDKNYDRSKLVGQIARCPVCHSISIQEVWDEAQS